MTVDYIQLSPTQNITVLVTTPVPRNRQAALAARLLKPNIVGGEQAGYIEAPADPRARARLQMMGGEFCGNAAMSLGAVLARADGLPEGGETEMLIEVSGSDASVACRIRREADAWEGTVRMPLPTRISERQLETARGAVRATLVEMPGIAHLILPSSAGLDEAALRALLPEWNRVIGADALGALTWDARKRYLDPLVYVPSAGSLVREHGCGSGSAAIGSWLALSKDQSVCVPVSQPGGVIRVNAEASDGRIAKLTITGRVTLLAEGSVEIEA